MTRLVERALADQLKVSRSPVRRALRLLADDGIVALAERGGHTLALTGTHSPRRSLPVGRTTTRGRQPAHRDRPPRRPAPRPDHRKRPRPPLRPHARPARDRHRGLDRPRFPGPVHAHLNGDVSLPAGHRIRRHTRTPALSSTAMARSRVPALTPTRPRPGPLRRARAARRPPPDPKTRRGVGSPQVVLQRGSKWGRDLRSGPALLARPSTREGCAGELQCQHESRQGETEHPIVGART